MMHSDFFISEQEDEDVQQLIREFVRPLPNDPMTRKVYIDRLQKEFGLIKEKHFTPVFLQVKRILSLTTDIPHIVRGSSGSSLVCYMLGITPTDPIQHCVALARFMNRCRTDFPDIDIDFPYNKRDIVYKRIEEQWPGMTARISNHIMYREKTALRQALKEAGVTGKIPKGPSIAKELHRCGLIGDHKDEETIQKIRNRAAELVGSFRCYSLHCGGIVVFETEKAVPQDLVLKPTLAGLQTMSQIKLDKDETEDAGLIKIDVLSNRGLAQWWDCRSLSVLEDYPQNDGPTAAIFSTGLNIGITFGESRGMRRILTRLKPRNPDDVAIALALIRPAASAEGNKTDFLEQWATVRKDLYSRNNVAKMKNLELGSHTESILKPIIYDDDAIDRIQAFLGCDDGDADRFRKIFAKSDPHGKVEFCRRASDIGYSKRMIEQQVHDLNALTLYSFCKSHAISYAVLVWALAYEKIHRPHDFWASTLSHCNSEYRAWVHYREARCSGLRLSRNPPPYKAEKGRLVAYTDSGKKVSEQMLLCGDGGEQVFRDMEQRGYWLTEEFLPGCHVTGNQQTLTFGPDRGRLLVKFCGIIATARITTHNTTVPLTLLCIGVENDRYIDVVIEGRHSELYGYTAIEGTGILSRRCLAGDYFDEQIEATRCHGVSLLVLQGRYAKTK